MCLRNVLAFLMVHVSHVSSLPTLSESCITFVSWVSYLAVVCSVLRIAQIAQELCRRHYSYYHQHVYYINDSLGFFQLVAYNQKLSSKKKDHDPDFAKISPAHQVVFLSLHRMK